LLELSCPRSDESRLEVDALASGMLDQAPWNLIDRAGKSESGVVA
jgi:hypothetical protein